jgi:hypothetical protein
LNTVITLNDTQAITLKAVSAREVAVQIPSVMTIKTQKDSKNKITKLLIEDWELSIGDIVYLNSPVGHGKLPFKVNYIEINPSALFRFSLLCTKLTKTSKYLMPLLFQPGVFESRTSMLWETNFINCYTGIREEGYMKHLYLVYRFSGDTRYTTFESKLLKHSLFNRRIDLDKYHVMYVFDISQDDLFEYHCFITGRYSKMTEVFKQKILKFSINPAVTPASSVPNHPIYGVLYKTPIRKKYIEEYVDSYVPEDLDLDSIPSEDEETYFGDIEIHNQEQRTDEF